MSLRLRFECRRCHRTNSRPYEGEDFKYCERCEGLPPPQDNVHWGCALFMFLLLSSPCLVALLMSMGIITFTTYSNV